jgi:NhaA family Na+:H+ antiporter
LLAIFFFVAWLELKREFDAGDRRDRRKAALPVVAALGGMIGPALIFIAINATTDAQPCRAGRSPHSARSAGESAALSEILRRSLTTRKLTSRFSFCDDLRARLIEASATTLKVPPRLPLCSLLVSKSSVDISLRGGAHRREQAGS